MSKDRVSPVADAPPLQNPASTTVNLPHVVPAPAVKAESAPVADAPAKKPGLWQYRGPGGVVELNTLEAVKDAIREHNARLEKGRTKTYKQLVTDGIIIEPR